MKRLLPFVSQQLLKPSQALYLEKNTQQRQEHKAKREQKQERNRNQIEQQMKQKKSNKLNQIKAKFE